MERATPTDELMRLWLQTRAPEVAEVLDQRMPPAAPLYPRSASFQVKQERWWAAARDPATHLSALLATLSDAPSDVVTERLAVLSRWPADPRVASALVRLYEHPSHLNLSTLPFWNALGAELVRRAEPRSLARLDAVLALGTGWASLFRPHMRPVIPGVLAATRVALVRALAQVPSRALTPSEQGRVAALRPAPGREAALAAVWANPDDVGARLVLADLLSSQGDPRGEFISLQCLNARTAAQTRRMQALLSAHLEAAAKRGKAKAESWAGVLAPFLTVRAWERGFPANVELTIKSRTQLGAVLGHPAWNTVHTLHLGAGTLGSPLEVVVHPAMTRLQRLEGLQVADVRALSKVPRTFPFRELELIDESPRLYGLLAKSQAFPQLQRVEVAVRLSAQAQAAARQALAEGRPEVRLAFAKSPSAVARARGARSAKDRFITELLAQHVRR